MMCNKMPLAVLISLIIVFMPLVYGISNEYDKNLTSTDTRVYGIDVSHWQGTINWKEVYNDGFRFAFVKATDGTSYEDSEFITNIENGHSAGLYVGAYHFAEPNSPVEAEATEEANHFLNVISPYLKDGYLVPVLDLEVNNNDLTWSQLTDWANTFCLTIYNSTGIRPIIYTSAYWAKNLGPSLTQWDLWIANYLYNPEESPSTGVWGTWSFWQYEDNGTVTGISGDVDEDVYNGNMESLIDEYVIHSNPGVKPLYEHLAAYEYASRWWNSKNPHYNYYANSGNESANFVSQALIAGGLSLWKGDDDSGGGLTGESNGTIPYCKALHENLVLYQNIDYTYVTAENFTVPGNLEVGDVIIFGNGSKLEQAAIVVYRSGNSVGIAMHSPDVWNVSINNYFPSVYNSIHYYHIINGTKKLIQPFKVTASALNVRAGPGTGYQILGTVQSGEVYVAYSYHIDSNGNKWWQFFFDDRVAWCAAWYTENVTNGVFEVSSTSYLNVRDGPGTGYSKDGEIYYGMLFAKNGQEYNQTEERTWYSFWWGSSPEWCASEYTQYQGVPEFTDYNIIIGILLILEVLFRKIKMKKS